MGPTGAGKSQLAKRIFEFKRQRSQLAGPFVEVNCATIRGDSAHSTAAGRELFAASRAKKASSNDADRLRKYLARFGLDFGVTSPTYRRQ